MVVPQKACPQGFSFKGSPERFKFPTPGRSFSEHQQAQWIKVEANEAS